MATDATTLFREWRDREVERLLRLGCSKAFVLQFMAQWWEPVGPTLEKRWAGVGGDSDND